MAHLLNGGLRRLTRTLTAAVIFSAALAAQSPTLTFQLGCNPSPATTTNTANFNYNAGQYPVLTSSAFVFRLNGTTGMWVYPIVNLRAPLVETEEGPGAELTDEQMVINHLLGITEVNYSWLLGQITPWSANNAFTDYTVSGNEQVTCTPTMLQVVLSLIGDETTPELVRSVYQPIHHPTSTATTQLYEWAARPTAWGSNTFAYLWSGMLVNSTSTGSDKIFDMHALVEHVLEYQALLNGGSVTHMMMDRDASTYPSGLPNPPDPDTKWSYYELITRYIYFDVDIQFVGVTSCIPSQGYTSPTAVPPVFIPSCPIPTLTFSNKVSVTFGKIGLVGMGNPDRRWAAPSLPRPLANSGTIGGVAEVRASAIVSPALITWKDSANVVRTSYMTYSRPGFWSFPVPTGTASGIGSIVSIICPSGTIIGNPTRASSQLDLQP